MRCPHCDAHPADGSWFCPCCFRTLAGRRRRRGSGPVVAVCGIAVALGLGALVGGFTGLPGSLSLPAHVESSAAAPVDPTPAEALTAVSGGSDAPDTRAATRQGRRHGSRH